MILNKQIYILYFSIGVKVRIEKFYLDDGTYIRFKKIGKGAPILLLHTFRNRLEYTDKLGKLLSRCDMVNFTK